MSQDQSKAKRFRKNNSFVGRKFDMPVQRVHTNSLLSITFFRPLLHKEMKHYFYIYFHHAKSLTGVIMIYPFSHRVLLFLQIASLVLSNRLQTRC